MVAQRAVHEAFEKRFLSHSLPRDREARRLFTNWTALTFAYINYHISDGSKNMTEEEVRAAKIEGRQRQLLLVFPRSAAALAQLAHESNWILIRGKHYSPQPHQWRPPPDWLERLRAAESESS